MDQGEDSPLSSNDGESSTGALNSSLTDLMTSLAVIFVLLMVIFLKQASDQSKVAKQQVEEELSELLKAKDLALKQDPKDPLTLRVMVGEENLRFAYNSAKVPADAAGFIQSFFQSFAENICNDSLRGKIDSIVIEGHTDKSGEKTPAGVRQNIALSQQRSFSVLIRALLAIQPDPKLYDCFLDLASASGRGSRNPILLDGEYNADQSRRVEIKIRVRSTEQQFKEMTLLDVQRIRPARPLPEIEEMEDGTPAVRKPIRSNVNPIQRRKPVPLIQDN